MTPEQQAAYVNAMTACALIEAMGMQAENEQRKAIGCSMAYTEEAFQKLLDRYPIHHNAVLNTFYP